MYKVALGVWVLWVGCVGMVLAGSDRLCSNWLSYADGWCCWDGVVQGYGGEECDLWTDINSYNSSFLTVPPGATAQMGCTFDCTRPSTYGSTLLALIYHSSIWYYKAWEPVRCEWGNVVRNLYDSAGVQLTTTRTENSLYFAACGTPVCGTTVGSCSAWSPHSIVGNTRKCNNGGIQNVSCSTSTTLPAQYSLYSRIHLMC